MSIDCHIHCALGAKGWLKEDKFTQDSPEIRSHFADILGRYQFYKVTCLRDGGDKNGLCVTFKKMAADYGIQVKIPIYALYNKGCYGSFLGKPQNGIEEIKKSIFHLKKQGADFIKILHSGIMCFSVFGKVTTRGFTKAQLNYAIKTSKDMGLKVMVHVNSPKAIMQAIECGADTIEHGYTMDEECICALAQLGTIWIPTLSPFANIVNSSAKSAEPYKKFAEKYLKEHQQAVAKAHRLGVIVGCGSDAGAAFVPHGKSAYSEMQALIGCGMSEKEIISNSKKIFDMF